MHGTYQNGILDFRGVDSGLPHWETWHVIQKLGTDKKFHSHGHGHRRASVHVCFCTKLWRLYFYLLTGDTVSFYYCGGTLTWSYEGALILLKKKDIMPELIENSEVLIEHSASITGFDSSNYCRLKYTGKLSK